VTRSRERLLWQGPEAIVQVNYRPVLSSERAPTSRNPQLSIVARPRTIVQVNYRPVLSSERAPTSRNPQLSIVARPRSNSSGKLQTRPFVREGAHFKKPAIVNREARCGDGFRMGA
jgi:hypothetical protein